MALGVSSRMLQHPRFVQVFPSVYRLESTELRPRDWIRAASLALPTDARVSHLTRFVPLGLHLGPLFPLHFTIGRDHHLPLLDGVFLHRTVRMPPHSSTGVDTVAAYVGAASNLRLIDVVALGDWLLHRGHLRWAPLARFLEEDHWRPGVAAARRAVPMLRSDAVSIPESTIRCLLVAAGLDTPEPNVELHADDGTFLGRGDLYLRRLRLVIEYEGLHHALDPEQLRRDVGRYARFRKHDLAYVQVDGSMLSSPRTVVDTIHRAMVARGYDGAPPRFGTRWQQLFEQPMPWRHERRAA